MAIRALAGWAFALLAAAGSAAQSQTASLMPLPQALKVDAAKSELGRQFFFDSRLSGDLSRACASCHLPRFAFSDGLALSRGYLGTRYFRKAPGLLNVALRPSLTWDARLDGADLATAVRDMVTEAHFMNADARLIQERVAQVPTYRERWRAVFGAGSEPYGPRIFEAVAEHLKTLRSTETRFDRYLRGDKHALNAIERRGLLLFEGKADCLRCHNGPLLSDHRLHRLGVPENPEIASDPLRSITLRRYLATLGVPNAMNERGDPGAYAVSKEEVDRGRFLTPSLRELAHTAPYMHNGMLPTLEAVIEFCDRGGGEGGELKPLGLSASEKRALLAFLQTLSGRLPKLEVPVQADYEGAGGGE